MEISNTVAATDATVLSVPPLPCLFGVSDRVAVMQSESRYIVYAALEGTAADILMLSLRCMSKWLA